MKYLLFDTNIYIDMLVNRNRINEELITTFRELLDFGEITLLLPAIVKYEVNKHLEKEIAEVGKIIQETIGKIGEVYWLNGLQENGINAKEYIDQATEPLRELHDLFLRNQDNYSSQLKTIIETIFGDENTILIEEDDALLSQVIKRKIYKKVPFHKGNKESFADGLILEILINIKRYIELKENDLVYFVTRNTRDFSVNNNTKKNDLDSNIIEDLKAKGIDSQIIYVTNFSKLVKDKLDDEIINAELKVQFEESLDEIDHYNYYYDNLRASVGLPPLSSFQDILEEKYSTSEEANEIVSMFMIMNTAYLELDEISQNYDDIILDKLNHIKVDKVISIFNSMAETFDLDIVFHTEDEIRVWIEEQINKNDFNIILPDFLDFNEDICFLDYEHNDMVFGWDDTKLDPEDGGQESIHCYLKKDDIITQGEIIITYGFVTEADFGNIGNSLEWNIDIVIHHIVEEIEEIKDDLVDFKRKQKELFYYLDDNL